MVSVNVVTVYYVSSSFYFPVSTKRGTKIRHVQIESKQSETDLQEDLCVLAMLTLPYEFQFRWHYWMELPMKPKAPGTIVFLHQKQLNFFSENQMPLCASLEEFFLKSFYSLKLLAVF